MIIVRCLFLMLFVTCCYGSNALAADKSASLASHYVFTPELKPSHDSFRLAKSTFLPDTYDDLGLSGRHNTKYDFNKNDCSAYPLKSCPTGSKCTKCPVGAGYRVNSCISPYILSGGTCSCPPVAPLIYPNDVCVGYCSPRAGAVRRCIAKSCTPSADQTGCTKGTQDCDNGCGKNTRKCCVACTHTVTSKPANSSYTYSSCKDDDGTKNIQTGWTCNAGYHKYGDNLCDKDCNVTNCSGFTLTSCPANGTCSTCTKTAANCSTDGIMYKLDSCKDGYSKSGDTCVKCSEGQTLVDGDCVACTSTLTARRDSNGYTYTAKKLTYNGVDYAVANATGGATWTAIKALCKDINYDLPDYNFAKHIIANLNINLNGGPIMTSTQCGSSSYLGYTSSTSYSCFEESKTGAADFVCIKPLCSANVTAETCPSGYSLNACGYGETAVSTTTGSQGSTCYKCSCASGYNSLTFRTANGYAATATKVTYKGETYAVVNYPTANGMTCSAADTRCAEERGYSLPTQEFAKYLITNKSNYGLNLGGGTAGVCTSTKCGSTQYLGCTSSSSCPCISNPTTTFATCIKKVCANAVEETCPTGYQLSTCTYTQKQTGSASSSLGNTCYKCEDDPSSSGSSGSSSSSSSCSTDYDDSGCSRISQNKYSHCVNTLGYCCHQTCTTNNGISIYSCHH